MAFSSFPLPGFLILMLTVTQIRILTLAPILTSAAFLSSKLPHPNPKGPFRARPSFA